ncbi:hypothetical protein DEU31_2560 [Brachybacterium sp. AG952]|nr:hypothetical protein DEU31_2560 [Brachybacterium sp. AG952]
MNIWTGRRTARNEREEMVENRSAGRRTARNEREEMVA